MLLFNNSVTDKSFDTCKKSCELKCSSVHNNRKHELRVNVY